MTPSPNLALISSPADPSPDCSTTGLYAGYTAAGTASTSTTLCARAARRDLTASAPPGFYVFKSAPLASSDPNGRYSHTLSWNAVGSPPSQVDLIDVIPYTGDGPANATTGHNGRTPASTFSGGVALSSGSVLSVVGDPAATFWYTTTAPGSINRDPANASNGAFGAPAGIWSICPGAVCPTSATAVRMVSGTAMNTVARSFTLPLKTSGNATGNQYTNDFSMRGAGLASLVISNDFTVTVVSGSIAGLVYMDQNNSGTVDSGEVGIANVQMCLTGYSYGPNGVDNAGAGDDVALPAGTCTNTLANGTYSFANLGAGKYTLTQTRNVGGLVGTTDGLDTVGTGGGTLTNGGAAANDVVSAIVLPLGYNLTGYNFGERQLTDLTSSMACTTSTSGTSGTCVATCTNNGPNAAQNASCQFTGTLPANVTANTCVAPATSTSLANGATLSCSISVSLPVNGTATVTVSAGAAATNDSNGGNVPTAGNNPSTKSINVVPNPPKLTLTKISLGGNNQPFTFTGDNGWVSQTITPTAAGAPGTAGAKQVLTAAGVATTITETAPSAASNYVLTGISCTNLGAGGTATVDLAARSVVLDAAAMAKGADVSCTFINTKKGKLTLVKSVPVGQGVTTDFTQTGIPLGAVGSPNPALATAFSITPNIVTGSSLIASQVYDKIDGGTVITLNELKSAATAGYGLVNIACTSAPGTPVVTPITTSVTPYMPAIPSGAVAGKASLTMVPGGDVTCTFSNVLNPKIVLNKNTLGGDESFGFTASSSLVGTSVQEIAGTLASVTTASGAAAVNTQVVGLGLASTNITFTENAHPTFTLTALSCSNLNSGVALTSTTTPSMNVDIPNRQLVLGGVLSGDVLQCTFTNAKNADFTLSKRWVNGKVGDKVDLPATTGFTNSLGAANTNLFSSTSTGGNTTVSPVVSISAGSTGTLSVEAFTVGSAADYVSANWLCSDGVNAEQSIAQGGVLTIPVFASGAAYDCRLSNVRKQATLSLNKTWLNALLNDTTVLNATTTPAGVVKATLNAQANSASETDAGVAATVASGDTLVLSEILGAANTGVYTKSAWACTGGGSLDAGTGTLTIQPEDTSKSMACTLTNTGSTSDMLATAPVTMAAKPGALVTVVTSCTNNGPDAATAPTCVVTGAPADATTTCTAAASPFVAGSQVQCTTRWTPLTAEVVTLTTTAGSANLDVDVTNNEATTVVSANPGISGRVYREASSPANTQDDGDGTDPGMVSALSLSCVGPAYSAGPITTNADGSYAFDGVPAGAFCTVTQNQPAGYTNAYNAFGEGGQSTTGGVAGSAGDSTITLQVPATGSTGNNFAEQSADTVSSLVCTPGAATFGDVVSCVATCQNNGPGAAVGSTCEFLGPLPAGVISNSCASTASSASLPNGSGLSCTLRFAAPVGSYTVRAGSGAVNDPNGGSVSTAGNNASSRAVVVAAPPLPPASDMSTTMVCTPASTLPGVSVSCVATCTNSGPSAATNASCQFIGPVPSGASVNSCATPSTSASLAVGGSLSCTLAFTSNAPMTMNLRSGGGASERQQRGCRPCSGQQWSQRGGVVWRPSHRAGTHIE